ncbi:MAG: hypothetical protein ACFCD0_21135 [Gemmataceae bacterium]
MHQSILDALRLEGAFELTTRALVKRFVSLPVGVAERLKCLSENEMTKLVIKIGAASSLAELRLVLPDAKG